MRVRHLITRCGWVVVASALFALSSSGTALAQLDITPAPSITPSKTVTTWIFQIAVASLALSVLVLIGFTLSYLRFAPRFSGREGKAPAVPPGSRPSTLARQAAAMRWTPAAAPAAGHAAAPSPAGRGTATAVAERPVPAPAPSEEVGTTTETAAPEAATPPAASAPAPPTPQPAQATPQSAQAAPQPAQATPQPAQAAPQPAPAAASHSAALDQETFDRVLAEQLAKGVDQRVAEGRARAAGVVAARKKSQG